MDSAEAEDKNGFNEHYRERKDSETPDQRERIESFWLHHLSSSSLTLKPMSFIQCSAFSFDATSHTLAVLELRIQLLLSILNSFM